MNCVGGNALLGCCCLYSAESKGRWAITRFSSCSHYAFTDLMLERWLSGIKSGKIGFWLANPTCSVFPEKLPKDTRTPLRRNIVKEFIEQAIHKLLSRVRKPRGKLWPIPIKLDPTISRRSKTSTKSSVVFRVPLTPVANQLHIFCDILTIPTILPGNPNLCRRVPLPRIYEAYTTGALVSAPLLYFSDCVNGGIDKAVGWRASRLLADWDGIAAGEDLWGYRGSVGPGGSNSRETGEQPMSRIGDSKSQVESVNQTKKESAVAEHGANGKRFCGDLGIIEWSDWRCRWRRGNVKAEVVRATEIRRRVGAFGMAHLRHLRPLSPQIENHLFSR